ncbi:nuclear transport factor 2 family protein [Dokdonia sp. Hel_I_53]|uniref:nuclear transport factor 2 family protein n=1 Tax=Dokdonia sp. Hel_I_53 TaxID=1566287 RepID=UPI00119D9D10|nr:nuclear transport factor 2 family protein [Dokdonia sp. Hel_I_53]
MTNKELLEKFYTSFAQGNFKGMTECYDENILFKDPVFGTLRGKRARAMWEMLLSRKSKDLEINYEIINSTTEQGNVRWTATYLYGKKKRKVINNVSSNFKFKNGKIVEHIDSFNLWKWTKQALGSIGYVLGWTPFLKKKMQDATNKKLDDFSGKKNYDI